MNKEKKLVPKLRFPEFREAERWSMAQLGELGEIITGKTPSTNEADLWSGEILFITPTDITEGEKYQCATQRTVVQTRGIKVLPQGSVVYTCIASIGKMALTVAPSITNQQINAVAPNDRTAKEFIYYSLANLTPWIKSIPATSTLPIINKTQFSGFIIPLPENKAEQQKIADCLSSLDELIAAQARKVDALKTHKKGLMQQLFPREGETQPRLRFPEFNNSGSWTESLLGGCLEEYREKSTKQDEYEVMTSARGGLVRQRDYYDNDRITERDNIGFNVLPPNYITYRSRSDDRQFYFNENNLGITGIVSVYYPVFRIINGSNRYLIELLSAFSRVVGKYSVGTSQTVLSINQLGRIRLPFPPTVEEQQRIADCLSSIDTLITTTTQELETLKTHKKGLMQQLFPSTEAIEA
jgi:type I restriction enzyme, S subunit